MSADGLRHTARAIGWVPTLIAILLSSVVVAIRPEPDDVFPLQLSAILLSTAAAFALDDPAFEVLAASPTSLLRRRFTRIAVVLLPILLVWTTQVLAHGTTDWDETLTLIAMFGGLLGLSFGISGVAGRRSSGHGGPTAAPTVLILIVVSTLIDPRWRPLPFGDIPGGWTALQTRWAIAAAAGALFLVASSHDPARQGQRVVRLDRAA